MTDTMGCTTIAGVILSREIFIILYKDLLK